MDKLIMIESQHSSNYIVSSNGNWKVEKVALKSQLTWAGVDQNWSVMRTCVASFKTQSRFNQRAKVMVSKTLSTGNKSGDISLLIQLNTPV